MAARRTPGCRATAPAPARPACRLHLRAATCVTHALPHMRLQEGLTDEDGLRLCYCILTKAQCDAQVNDDGRR